MELKLVKINTDLICSVRNSKYLFLKEVTKISQCEDTSPSAFINFSFGRAPFPISIEK